MRSLAILMVATTALLTASCRKRNGHAPPCNTVAADVVKIARAEIAAAKLSQADLHMANDQLSPLGDALASACDRDEWGDDVRACLDGAKTVKAATDCQKLLSDAQRQALANASTVK
jgi:hypothetical protein